MARFGGKEGRAAVSEQAEEARKRRQLVESMKADDEEEEKSGDEDEEDQEEESDDDGDEDEASMALEALARAEGGGDLEYLRADAAPGVNIPDRVMALPFMQAGLKKRQQEIEDLADRLIGDLFADEEEAEAKETEEVPDQDTTDDETDEEKEGTKTQPLRAPVLKPTPPEEPKSFPSRGRKRPAPSTEDSFLEFQDLQEEEEVVRTEKVAADAKDLLRQAFVVAEEDAPQALETPAQKARKRQRRLPGWGSWVTSVEDLDDGEAKAFFEQKASKTGKGAAAMEAAASGAEACEASVLDKHGTRQVPFPFKTAEEYNAHLARPTGPEWNSQQVFDKLVKPRVQLRLGKIIPPHKLSAEESAEVWAAYEKTQRPRKLRTTAKF